jgi:hypothetical protein
VMAAVSEFTISASVRFMCTSERSRCCVVHIHIRGVSQLQRFVERAFGCRREHRPKQSWWVNESIKPPKLYNDYHYNQDHVVIWHTHSSTVAINDKTYYGYKVLSSILTSARFCIFQGGRDHRCA